MADENNDEMHSPSKKKQRRNKQYYEKHKAVLKSSKCTYQFKMEVPKEDEHRLDEIKIKINNAKERLKQLNSKTTNLDLMEALIESWLDSTESQVPLSPVQLSVDPANSVNDPIQLLSRIPPSLANPKYQLHSVCKENDEIYLVCGTALERLFQYIIENGNVCSCGNKFDVSRLKIERVTKRNHSVKVVFGCEKKHVVEWFSSSIMSSPSAGKYYVNVRCVQKFLVYNIYIAYIHTYEKYISIYVYINIHI